MLFAGLMITKDGPKLIEYNVRFGDPECQVLMLRMMSDLVPALMAARDGQLKNFDLRWYPDAALTVVMAAKGYPGDYNGARSSKASMPPRRSKASRSSTPARRPTAAKSSPMAGACSMSAARGKTVREAQTRAYAGRRSHQMAGWLLPPRYRLARDRA